MNEESKNKYDRLLLLLCNSALIVALLIGLGAAWIFISSKPKSPVSRSVSVSSVPLATAAYNESEIHESTKLRKFALNALLAPLIDDSVPARWTDMALDHMCNGATSVLVDGRPLVAGTPVPDQPFSIRWEMDYCTPLGPEMPLSGGVMLLVSHEDAELHALVMPDRLQIHGSRGQIHVSSTFNAKLSLLGLFDIR